MPWTGFFKTGIRSINKEPKSEVRKQLSFLYGMYPFLLFIYSGDYIPI